MYNIVKQIKKLLHQKQKILNKKKAKKIKENEKNY